MVISRPWLTWGNTAYRHHAQLVKLLVLQIETQKTIFTETLSGFLDPHLEPDVIKDLFEVSNSRKGLEKWRSRNVQEALDARLRPQVRTVLQKNIGAMYEVIRQLQEVYPEENIKHSVSPHFECTKLSSTDSYKDVTTEEKASTEADEVHRSRIIPHETYGTHPVV